MATSRVTLARIIPERRPQHLYNTKTTVPTHLSPNLWLHLEPRLTFKTDRQRICSGIPLQTKTFISLTSYSFLSNSLAWRPRTCHCIKWLAIHHWFHQSRRVRGSLSAWNCRDRLDSVDTGSRRWASRRRRRSCQPQADAFATRQRSKLTNRRNNARQTWTTFEESQMFQAHYISSW